MFVILKQSTNTKLNRTIYNFNSKKLNVKFRAMVKNKYNNNKLIPLYFYREITYFLKGFLT